MVEAIGDFSDNEDSELIDAIAHYPEIFNPGHEGYRKQQLKEQQWDEIAKKVNKTVEQCKRRWKNHRDNYFKQKRLRKKTDRPRRKNSIIEKLSFLENVGARSRMCPKDKKGAGSLSDAADSLILEIDSSSEIPAQYIFQETDEEGTFEPEVSQTCTLNDDASDSKLITTRLLLELIKKSDLEKDQLRGQVASLQSKLNDLTELDLFFRCISETIRKFPPTVVCDVKSKIFKIISEEEMKLCQKPSKSNTDAVVVKKVS